MLHEKILECNPSFRNRFRDEADLKKFLNKLAKCIPFVGAGLSAPQFPLWRDFIINVASRTNKETLANVQELLNENELEAAASMVFQEFGGTPNAFREIGTEIFNQPTKYEVFRDLAVGVLPRIYNKVLTTNYDHVLEKMYQHHCESNQSSLLLPEVADYKQPERIDAILFNPDQRGIIKLHGGFDTINSYIFTKEDYEKWYSAERSEHQSLNDIFKKLFERQPIIFMGASLVHERFFQLWANIAEQDRGFYHYAIVEMKEDPDEQKSLENLLKKYYIEPIWYPHGEHEYVKYILQQIAQCKGELAPEDNVPFNNVFVDRSDNNSVKSILSEIYGNDHQGSSLEKRIKESTLSNFDRKFVYIGGLGGIGKTTVLHQLYHTIKDSLGNIANTNIIIRSIEYSDSWEDTLKANGINIKDREHNYLLFVDNLTENCYFNDNLSNFFMHCQLFTTSRLAIDKSELNDIVKFAKVYFFDLGWEFSSPIKLFQEYFRSGEAKLWLPERTLIEKFSQLAGNHTLTIEVLAKHARLKCKEMGFNEARKQLHAFYDELVESGFNLNSLMGLGRNKDEKTYYLELTTHLQTLLHKDELSESIFALMQNFSLLADSDFRPSDIGFQYFKDDMEHALRLGWINSDNESYRMHDVIKKLVNYTTEGNHIEYYSARNLVLSLGRTLNKREIEKKNKSVFNELDSIHHAQSVFDYYRDGMDDPDKFELASYNPLKPEYDDAFIELVNNLFSSYDDIGLREKAYEGSILAEKLRKNFRGYANYSYSVSANSIAYLCCHYEAADKSKSLTYYKSADLSLADSFQTNDKEAMVLRGKILSNIGAYYQDRLRKSVKTDHDAAMQEYEQAIKYHSKSLELRQATCRKYPEDTSLERYIYIVTNSLAGDHFYAQKYMQSIQLRKSVLPDMERYYGKSDDNLFLALRNIGDTYKLVVSKLDSDQIVDGFDAKNIVQYAQTGIDFLKKAIDMMKELDPQNTGAIERPNESLNYLLGIIDKHQK